MGDSPQYLFSIFTALQGGGFGVYPKFVPTVYTADRLHTTPSVQSHLTRFVVGV